MVLTSGTRLGMYEIVSALGAGGMGEVYRARDPTLHRDVALKVLPALVASDPDRRARFRREAQVLAALNHPNIAAIYGFEESTSLHALVLELVEGPTLAERIAHGAIPLDEALAIARQIAEALEAAHEVGIVHRDLKPANIKLRPDGTVKVLDFGLAKALEPVPVAGAETATSPAITSPALTQLGMILGTAAYMSPEQARGRQADKRSDVWAFGAVLYELLSRRRAFRGDDIADTLAAVLRQDVDWTALPASVPPPVRRLIERCLERDVRRRLRDIGEARIVLEDSAAIVATGSSAVSAPPALRDRVRPSWRRALPFVVSAILAGGASAMMAWHFKPSASPEVTRLQYMLPEDQLFTGVARRVLDISPDGTRMVYVANGRLYLRSMSEREARPIRGTELYQAVANPVFSPDGRSIAFHAISDQTLKRIAAAGGAAVTICAADLPFGMSWGTDGILFADGAKGIRRVSPNGGTPELLAGLQDGETAASPQMLPGGRDLLFTVTTGTAPNRWDNARVVAQSLATGKRTTIVTGGSDGRYVDTGHVLYEFGGTVFAIPFDAQHPAAGGTPTPVVTGVMRSGVSGAADFGVSANGTLIYVPGTLQSTAGQTEIVVADRKQRTETLGLPPGTYMVPRVAPDGSRIAFMIDDGTQANVYTYDLSGANGMQRLTFGGNNRFPAWASKDRVAFQSDRDGDLGIFWQSASGGPPERLTTAAPGTAHVPESWSPKGDVLLFSVVKGSDQSLWSYSMRDRKAEPFGGVLSSGPIGAVFSPDGRWVAYTTAERNGAMIYVQPFPASGTRYQLPAAASEMALQPLWSADGKELFYNPGPGRLAWVGVTTHPTFAFGNPQAGPRPFQTGPPSVRRAFDITPRGAFAGKFVGLAQEGQAKSGSTTATQIEVVLNWFEELRKVAPRTN